MAFLEAFRMAWQAITGHKLRSSLTLLGMVIGVFAIIVSVTAVKVIDVYFKEKLDFLGSSTFTLSRRPMIQMGDDRASRNRPPITMEQVDRLEAMVGDRMTISVMEGFDLGDVEYAGRKTERNIGLVGSDENMLGNYSYELASGRFFTDADVQFGRPVTVLPEGVAEFLFPNENPLGKLVRFKSLRLEVVGVTKNKGSFLGFNQDNRIFIPVTYAMTVYGGGQRDMGSISLRVASVEAIPAAMEEVQGRMRVIRKVEPGEDNNFELSTNESLTQIFEAFTGTLTAGGAGIGLIALLAAGIGIMNIMLVSVTERTREIGVRKSVGARRKDIMRQFLLEAFFMCQLGGIVGILLGALVGNLTALYFEISAAFPVDWAIGAVVMVTVVSLVFGGYPAFKAAGLNPIDALRYE